MGEREFEPPDPRGSVLWACGVPECQTPVWRKGDWCEPHNAMMRLPGQERVLWQEPAADEGGAG